MSFTLSKETLKDFLTFLAIVSVFCGTFALLFSLSNASPLGHDESVYLAKARSWIEGTPADEFEIYRPIGMAGISWSLLQISQSEPFLRVFGIIFGALTILFLYLLFDRLFNAWIALATCIVVATSFLFLQQAPSLLNDIPTSGLLLGVLWLLYLHFETSGKSKSIYLAGPLAALAFYLRYGTASSLVIIAVLSVGILLPQFIKKKGDFSKLRFATFIALVLFLPHFIQSFIATKKPLGILRLSGKAAHRQYLGEGLVTYIKWLPDEIGGWVLGITAILGVIATIVIIFFLIFKRNLPEHYVRLLWTGSIGIVNFIVIGLLVHAEARYVFFSMAILTGTGIAAIYYMLENHGKLFARSFLVIFSIIVLLFGLQHYNEAFLLFREQENDPGRRAQIQAAEFIWNNSNGDCTIWTLTTYRPAIAWYSKCHTKRVISYDIFQKDFLDNIRDSHYSIAYTLLKKDLLGNHNAEAFGVTLTEIFRTDTKTTRGELIVYRIERNNPDEEDYLKLLEMKNDVPALVY